MIAGIEDKTYAELKEQREELVKQVVAFAGVDPDELARHYLHARMDATQRDEKLAEQGKAITALQDSLQAVKERKERADRELAQTQQVLESVRRCAQETSLADKVTVDAVRKSLAKETARADRLKALSSISREAVVQAAAILNTAASQMTVEAADQGE